MEKKIIFFDVDGTIVPHIKDHKSINKIVKDAIRQTRAKGHYCFIASGRSKGFLQDDIIDCEFDGYVLSNGAHLVFQNKNLKVEYLDYTSTKKLIEFLRDNKIDYILETDEFYCSESKDNPLVPWCYEVGANEDCIQFSVGEYEYAHATKLQLYLENDKKREIINSQLNDFYYEIHPGFTNAEVSSKTRTKATGILEVLNILDIDVQDSICFGDGLNDIEMFQTVGHSIAMGNAREEVKNVADEICLSAADDGVAHKLKEMFEL